MEIIKEHDILIIGGGAAGLRAATVAAEHNPKLSIAIISKVYPTRSHTVSAEGGIAAAIAKNDTTEKHATDTIKGSDYLADQDTVEFFTEHCKEEIELLDQQGCLWDRTKDGKIAVRLFGGMSTKRTVYAADKTGFFMLHSLFERTLLHKNIHRYDEWYVTKIFTDEKGANGVMAINQKEGDLITFNAKAIILATGGAGMIFEKTTNAAIKTGDGMALAYKEGASLKDMEFIQFHPTTLPKTGILITEAARGEGGYLINNKQERFLKNYVPNKMELGPRDLLTRAIISEYKKGKGFKDANGSYIQLDIRHLGEKVINEKLPQVRELAKNFANIDPVNRPIPVTPAQHYMMGGVHTNTKSETDIPQLYAAGETACTGMHGANRLGSNSLAECLVFGKTAGESAAKTAEKSTTTTLNNKQIQEEEDRINKILANNGKENPYKIHEEMKKTMTKHAGIIRDEENIKEGIAKIKDLQTRFQNIKINQSNKVFNNELINALEIEGMLQTSEAILTTALARKETRGSHFREDHQSRDDKNYLKHYLIKKSDNGPKLSELPVKITKWKPTERKY